MALSTITFKELEAQVRAETGATDYANPNQTTVMRWTNIALKKIARLTQPIDSPWGRNASALTRLASTGLIHAPGDVGAFTASTLTFSGITGITQAYVGGIVFWNDRSANLRAFWGVIDEVNTALTAFTVRSNYKGTGAVANIASADLLYLAKPYPSFSEGASLSSVAFMELVKVVDATNGIAARVDGDTFSSFGSNPNFDNSIIWQYAGNGVMLGKGEDISAYGTLTLTFEERPTTITAVTDFIDLKPEHIGILKDEVVRWVLNFLGESERVKQIGNPIEALEQKFKQRAGERAVRQLQSDSRSRRI